MAKRGSGRQQPLRFNSEDRAIDERIAAVLEFGRFAGPTGDIGQLLDEIERGRGLPQPV